MNFITKKLVSIYQFVERIFKLLFFKESYLHASGFIHSVKKKMPCDNVNNFLPWMNYNAISFLRQRLSKDLVMFEFGSGYSTVFYANLVSSVTSVEYDKEWLHKIKEIVPANAELIYKELDYDGEYCRSIWSNDKKFDVVIVDGRDRVRCAKNAVNSLTSRGVVIFDDSQREKYIEGMDYLVGQGFRRLDFEGLKPNNHKSFRTSIFYRDDNCLNL